MTAAAGRGSTAAFCGPSTLQEELLEAGAAGYEITGMTVAKRAPGGKESTSCRCAVSSSVASSCPF